MTTINTSIQNIYFNVIRKQVYPDETNFPKNFAQYKFIKKCNPELFKEYIEFLIKTKAENENMLKENNSLRLAISLKNINLHINNIINNYNKSENANLLWQEGYNQKSEINEATPKQLEKEEDNQLDELICDEIKDNENLERNIVSFELPLADDLVGSALINREEIVVNEEYSEYEMDNDWSILSFICGCNCFL